jgi:hypothetical protein
MRKQALLAIGFGLLLVLTLHTWVFGACTCYVAGQIDLHQNCTCTTLRLWVWELVNPDTGYEDWVLKGEKVVHDMETFTFTVVCGIGQCNNPAKLKSKGRELAEFDLPGRNQTVGVGLIYDPDTCSRKKESPVPPPGP